MSAKKDTAVIVVDMQVAFIGSMPDLERVRLIDSNISLLEHCQNRDVPVVGLKYTRRGNYPDELESAVNNIPGSRFLYKRDDDGFTNPRLRNHLKRLGVERIVITGVNAGFCVQSTAESALHEGFKIATSKDLIAHNSGVGSLTSAYNWFRKNGTLFERYQDMLRTL